MRINWVSPIFSWLYNDEKVKRTIILISSLSVITGVILCIIEAGNASFIEKIGHFILYTLVWAFEYALVIPFIIGAILTVICFLYAFFKELYKEWKNAKKPPIR